MYNSQGMTSAEVASRLGITSVSVRQLLKSGRLIQSGIAGQTILIDPVSVERLTATGTRRGTAWAPATAWAALALLSGQDVKWFRSSSERSRLKKSLQSLDANEVQLLSRNKAATARYRAVPEAVSMVEEYLMVSGGAAMRDKPTAARFGLTGGGGYAEGYLMKGDAQSLIEAFGLISDPQGNVTIREIESDEAFEEGRAPVAVIAVDLMDSLTTRERSAGTAVLEELLHGRDVERSR